jgi:hypothetical protein
MPDTGARARRPGDILFAFDDSSAVFDDDSAPWDDRSTAVRLPRKVLASGSPGIEAIEPRVRNAIAGLFPRQEPEAEDRRGHWNAGKIVRQPVLRPQSPGRVRARLEEREE